MIRARMVLMVAAAAISGFGCPSTGGVRDVTVHTDCPGTVTVTGTATVSTNAKGVTVIHVSLDFSCGDTALRGTIQFDPRSEVPLTPRWPGGTNRQTTDAKGHLEFDVEVPNYTPDQVRGTRFKLLFERPGAATAGTPQSTSPAGEVTVK